MLPDIAWLAGAAVVALLVAARAHAGERWFNDRSRFWSPIRRVAIPLLDRTLRNVDEGLYATNRATRAEHVATVDVPPAQVLEDLAEAGYQPQPLAGLKTDWAGRTEIASRARFHGAKPFAGAPEWLRPRQVHVTLFADTVEPDMIPVIGELEEVERTIVTAHEEANPWRPDSWRDHYRGRTLDVDLGRRLAADDLAIELKNA